MTRFKEKPIRRLTTQVLSSQYGVDTDKPLVVELLCMAGKDFLAIRPLCSRNRRELISVFDVYAFAIRCRVNLQTLEVARAKKARKAERLAAERQRRAEKRLLR